MRRTSSFLVTIVGLGLFACGGGGGGSDGGADVPIEVAPDVAEVAPDLPHDSTPEIDTHEVCTPDCAGKACGDDGCGGSCGACGAGTECSADGACEPVLQCQVDADCKGECDTLTACQLCTCVDNACVKKAVAGCCDSDAQCTNKCPGLTACQVCSCGEGNTCGKEAIPGCCLVDADCGAGFECTAHACVAKVVKCTDPGVSSDFCDGKCTQLDFCQTCDCVVASGQCGKVYHRGESCCIDSLQDCDDGNAATQDDCPSPGAACDHVPIPCAGVATTFLQANFDQGSLAQFDVVDDNDATDAVTWRLDGSAPRSGAYAVYFGDPKCHTYYTGALDAACEPVDLVQSDAGHVRATLRTKSLTLGSSTAACAYALVFWARLEGVPTWPAPPASPGPAQTFDQLRVYVIDTAGPHEVFASATDTATNSTDGQWRQFAADLTQWWGKSIKVAFTFDSVDGTNNFHYGVMLDDVEVRSLAGVTQCSAATCPSDGKVCTSDACTFFANSTTGVGVCAFLNDDPACQDCTQDSQCNGGTCQDGACVEGKCVYTLDVTCCKAVLEGVTQQWDFASGLASWAVEDASDDVVTWQPLEGGGVGGSTGLYFGDPGHPCVLEPESLCPSYDNGLPVHGTVVSPSVVLPSGSGHQLLTFNLKLSTEWDGETLESFSNPAGVDRLSLYVRVGATSTMVWNSDAIAGSTATVDADGILRPKWQLISVDLSTYKGMAVSFGFTFDSGDYKENDFEGATLDNVALVVGCEKPCTKDSSCNDGKPCTKDYCMAGICKHETTGECCTQATDCDDGNTCTVDTCVGNLCKHPYLVDAQCCQEGTIAGSAFDFETATLPADYGVTVPAGSSVTWTVSDARATKGAQSLWFGDPATGTYENLVGGASVRSQGTLDLPLFKVPLGGLPVLEFDLYLETEWSGVSGLWDPPTDTQFDKLSVYANGVEIWNSYVFELAGSTCGAGCEFRTVQASLANFANQNVVLTFAFDSADGQDNAHAGPFVDNLRVTWLCADFECFNSFECDDPGDPGDECTRDRCESKQCFFQPTLAPGCCYPTDLKTEGFEEATPAISTSGGSGAVKWQVASTSQGARVHGGEHGLYFGNPSLKTYADGANAVSATASWAFTVPAAGYRLEWWQWLGLDSDDLNVTVSDVLTVRVFDPSNPGDPGVIFTNKPSYGFYHVWAREWVSLDTWAGKSVVVIFKFESGDGQNNQGEGVYVDDLRVFEPCE